MSSQVMWLLIILGVIAVCALVGAAFWFGRRQRTARPAAARVHVHSAADSWRDILSQLPHSSRGYPVVVVLGERGSGKSRLIREAFAARTGFAGSALTARAGAHVSAFVPGQLLIQEVAGELFEADGSDALVQLHDLWKPMALEIALVVFAGAASTSTELHSQRVRRVLDLLTDLRGGSAPRCCVCVTRLDEFSEGFTELVSSAEQAGADTGSAISIASAAELQAVWDDRFRDCYYAALARLPISELVRVSSFPERSGPELASHVEALLSAILRGRVRSGSILLALSAIPEREKAALFGDPFAPDEVRLREDHRLRERSRMRRSGALTAVACAAITVGYVWHLGTVQHSLEAVTAFRLAALRARVVDERSGSALAAEPELRAELAIDAALNPFYPPLRLAFPKQKDSAVSDFLTQVRDLDLVPQTAAPDRSQRVYAASLLYAARDSALGLLIRPSAELWASNLGLPVTTVEHYLEYSKQAWAGTLMAPPVADQDVRNEEWSGFLGRLDSALQRGRFQQPEELAELQAQAVRLSLAMRWAVQEPKLRPVIRLLEYQRGGPAVQALLGGKSATVLQAPDWVNQHREALQALLDLLRNTPAAVPPVAGKNLRLALADLDTIAAPVASGSVAVLTLQVDGATKSYQPAVLSKLISDSRAAFYLQALLQNLAATQRSLFFIDQHSYQALPSSTVIGRGPSASIAGIYTQAAITAEIVAPLAALETNLNAAHIPEASRAALQALIQRQLDGYGVALQAALYAYLRSFRFDATDVSVLRTNLGSMLPDASWFSEFWANIAASAGVPLGDSEQLRPIRRAVAPFAPIVTLMAEDKGTFPNLKPYSASLTKLVPALEAEPLLGGAPQAGALADRLFPIGKLGLALLDPAKPGPLAEIDDWLGKSNVIDEELRAPFRAPVLAVYEQALRSVELVASAAYSNEIRPLIQPLLNQFPFDPSATSDASPTEALAVLGPKGSFLAAFEQVYGPITQRDRKQNFSARRVPGFRAVALSPEALAFGKWVSLLDAKLWNGSGEPQPIALTVRAFLLPEIQNGTESATSLGVLRSGSTTIAAFNQAATWKPLAVEWWTASPAGLGVEFTGLDGSSRRALSLEAAGAAWRFFHLLCRGTLSGGVVRWSLDDSHERDVAFDVRPDPWDSLVAPLNRGRSCSAVLPVD